MYLIYKNIYALPSLLYQSSLRWYCWHTMFFSLAFHWKKTLSEFDIFNIWYLTCFLIFPDGPVYEWEFIGGKRLDRSDDKPNVQPSITPGKMSPQPHLPSPRLHLSNYIADFCQNLAKIVEPPIIRTIIQFGKKKSWSLGKAVFKNLI